MLGNLKHSVLSHFDAPLRLILGRNGSKKALFSPQKGLKKALKGGLGSKKLKKTLQEIDLEGGL